MDDVFGKVIEVNNDESPNVVRRQYTTSNFERGSPGHSFDERIERRLSRPKLNTG